MSQVEAERCENFKRGGLPWVRWCSSNKVNNCFTLTHTLVSLQAKLPSPRTAASGGTLTTPGRGECEEESHSHKARRRWRRHARRPWCCCVAVVVTLVVVCTKRNRLAFMRTHAASGPGGRLHTELTHTRTHMHCATNRGLVKLFPFFFTS